MEWHSLEIKEIFKILGSNEKGLSKEEAKKRLKKFGLNEIRREKRVSAKRIFIRQFSNLFVLILFATIFVCLFIGKFLDASLIFLFIVLIISIGFLQEYKAEKSLEALRKLITRKAIVVRDGKEIEINAKKIVPGDVVILRVGDKVPADCRIFEAINLEIDESLLTGESIPVRKQIKPIKKEVMLAEKSNMAFMGTLVTSGRGKGIVVSTGMQTEIGKIAKAIQVEEFKSPLKAKLEILARQIALIVGVTVFSIFLIGIFRGIDFYKMFLTSIALAVSAIPEALPLVITVALAFGVRKAAKKKALIRRLGSIETLGRIDVICCDKTGTLTKNEMTVKEIFIGRKIFVSGEGYKPEGNFFENHKKIDPLKDEKLFLLLKAANLCNIASLESDIFGNWWIIGSPTEGCLLTLAKKGKLPDLRKEYKLLAENPFDPKRKRMSVVYEENGKKFVYVKGAPENVLNVCKISKKQKNIFLKETEKMAKNGLRVLAFAYKELPEKVKEFSIKEIEKDLKFIGIVGILDPIRKEVKNAIKIAKKAGIKLIIISGDHELTTLNVAKKLGIKSKVLTGNELDKIDEEELDKIVDKILIYARTSPEHKLRIIKALKRKGYIVAMTGDGVNDAPALKFADIGIAMGIKGSEVTKEASDLILLDDNFATIVEAVKEGRRIFKNIKKTIVYLLSTSLAEILLILAAIFAGFPLPLIALQILWINIVTEGIPASSLAIEKEEPDLMKGKMKKEKHLLENILPKIIGQGILMGIGSFILFTIFLPNYAKAMALAFNTLVLFEIFNLFNCRSLKFSIFKIGIFSNKSAIFAAFIAFLLQFIAINYLFPIFQITPLNLNEWLLSILTASSILIISEIRKNFKPLSFLPV